MRLPIAKDCQIFKNFSKNFSNLKSFLVRSSPNSVFVIQCTSLFSFKSSLALDFCLKFIFWELLVPQLFSVFNLSILRTKLILYLEPFCRPLNATFRRRLKNFVFNVFDIFVEFSNYSCRPVGVSSSSKVSAVSSCLGVGSSTSAIAIGMYIGPSGSKTGNRK